MGLKEQIQKIANQAVANYNNNKSFLTNASANSAAQYLAVVVSYDSSGYAVQYADGTSDIVSGGGDAPIAIGSTVIVLNGVIIGS